MTTERNRILNELLETARDLRECGVASDVDAESPVMTDPDVMGGMPCFAGTRVSIDIVLGSLDEGMSKDEVRESYPFLSDAHIAAARVYLAVHPRRGRP